MGLFDMFKSDTGDKMTPHLAFATSLMYMMASDGEMDNEEVGHLLSVLGGSKDDGGAIGVGAQNRELLRKAQQTVRTKNVDQFLSESASLLTSAQKICVLTNLVDSSLSDGVAEPEEQALFAKFMQAYQITEDQFETYFKVLSVKNDRSIFTNENHPNNQSGFSITI